MHNSCRLPVVLRRYALKYGLEDEVDIKENIQRINKYFLGFMSCKMEKKTSTGESKYRRAEDIEDFAKVPGLS
jgi:hypothetical protein